MDNLNTCTICGNKNTGKFCSECGSEFKQPVCIKCGEIVSGKFCQSCGSKVSEVDIVSSSLIMKNYDWISGTTKSFRIYKDEFEIVEKDSTKSNIIKLPINEISMIYLKPITKTSQYGYFKLVLDNSNVSPKYAESFLINDNYTIQFDRNSSDKLQKYIDEVITDIKVKIIVDHINLSSSILTKTVSSNSLIQSVNRTLNKITEVENERVTRFQDKKRELNEQGVAYCPKCLSTSLSGNKKGFGIGKAIIGVAATGGIGLIAGNIGAKKVRVTCLKCGYQFWAGKR